MKKSQEVYSLFFNAYRKLKLAITNIDGMRMHFENDWITNLLIFSS